MSFIAGVVAVVAFVVIMYIIIRSANKEAQEIADKKHKPTKPFKFKVLK